MKARIDNPAVTLGAVQKLQELGTLAAKAGVPETTLQMVDLRASQINGCSVCVDIHTRELKAAGEPDERIFAVSAWREAPYYSDAERAALALTEAATRLADRSDPVPDAVWQEATRHYDDRGLAGLVFAIAMINAFNRINTATRQISGNWVGQHVKGEQRGHRAA
ncbi:MAG: carboxymuconolactone decarboxylase family protein [Candidatus Dormibacteraeota bacterium]|nr:carboxymuconolactone decarboxylase family protein [Candidatus Dormibacteraeota bacterium]